MLFSLFVGMLILNVIGEGIFMSEALITIAALKHGFHAALVFPMIVQMFLVEITSWTSWTLKFTRSFLVFYSVMTFKTPIIFKIFITNRALD